MSNFTGLDRWKNQQGGKQMKRAIFLHTLICICLAALPATFGQAQSKSDGKKVCPFSIVGLWRSEVTMQTKSIFFAFSPEGYVTLLGHSPNMLPQDFEMIESVNYRLDTPAAPKSIEFTAARGNDAFAPGTTRLEITKYGDESFTTLDTSSGQKTRWVREQTHRYFLTFAARPDPSQTGGPTFAMWTVLDGRKTVREALGVQLIKNSEGQSLPVFGPISDEFCDRIIEEIDRDAKRHKEEGTLMRLELKAAEFETTWHLYQQWSKEVQTKSLPYQDAYLNELEFLRKLAESLNICGENVKLLKLSEQERNNLISEHRLWQYTLAYIRAMRKQNYELHVNDVEFPWQWRPMIQLPEQ
jgi:hypothetical protein